MKLENADELLAEIGSLSMCEREDCVRPTDRVRNVAGHRLCLECHLDLVYACHDDWRDPDFQALVKDGNWRNIFKPTPAQLARFLAATPARRVAP